MGVTISVEDFLSRGKSKMSSCWAELPGLSEKMSFRDELPGLPEKMSSRGELSGLSEKMSSRGELPRLSESIPLSLSLLSVQLDKDAGASKVEIWLPVTPLSSLPEVTILRFSRYLTVSCVVTDKLTYWK